MPPPIPEGAFVEKIFLQKAGNYAIIETEVKKEMGDAWRDFRVSSTVVCAAVRCCHCISCPRI
jgi:hypothetical protein